MLFTIDVGNSHTVTGLFKNGKLLGHWRLKSDRKRTADELAIRYHSLFSMAGIDKGDISGIILASVVPTLETAWVNCCEKHYSDNLTTAIGVITAENVKDHIRICTDNPEEVGADRLVNAIWVYNTYQSDVIVIDFGTAVTFDCVSRNCEYLGGTILPGIAISLDALAGHTAKLPLVDISEPPERVIGKSTTEAMKSGILYGYGALVDGLVNKIRLEMDCSAKNLKVIATGGMAKLISPFTTTIQDTDTMITLKGLELIHRRWNK